MRLLFFLFLSSVMAPAGQVLISTVAKVKNHVVTSREVEIHNHLDKVLGFLGEMTPVDDPVEKVIREWLLYYEASSFYNTGLASSQIQKSMGDAQKKLSGHKDWQRLGVTQSELKQMVERRLQAERLYKFKKKASVLPVSDAEVESEYSQNRIRYGNLSFEEVRTQIRNNKIQQNLDVRMNHWFEVLERKYKVQRFAGFKAAK
ncbi:MAG: hypothetical protein KDD33_10240 [Bdellovibrionales bacterium]|nr:hypothetical protein [Bdellovibrionales bacterium]